MLTIGFLLMALASCTNKEPTKSKESAAKVAEPEYLFHSPAGDRYVEINPEGETVLPNGRIVSPVGDLYRIHPHPYGLAVSPDGRWVVTSNSGRPVSLSVLDLKNPDKTQLYQIPEEPGKEPDVLAAAFMGLAIDRKSETLYVAGGVDWSVMAFDLKSRKRLFEIKCDHEADGERYKDGFIGDMVLTSDDRYLLAVDQANFRVVVIDLEKKEAAHSLAVGRYPFGIELSPDGKRAYVANVGIYEYSHYTTESGKRTTVPNPVLGLPSQEAVEGVTKDGVVTPALGDPNDIRAMSVWTLDVRKPTKATVVGKTKTGHLVGEELEDFPAVGGSSPNSIVVTDDLVYVSNGSNDSLTVIDAQSGDRVRDIDLTIDPKLDKFRGIIPFGLALSPDGKTLFVAESGINAIGVMSLPDGNMLGHIPTAWFPARVSVSPDGKQLYVANAKGLGSGPNAGPNHEKGSPTKIASLMRGYIQVIDLRSALSDLDAMTAKVIANTVTVVPASDHGREEGHPVPPWSGAWKSPIKHVIYVTKENRTYDEIFGAMKGGRGDFDLCRLGRPITVENSDGSKVVDDVLLMPNHVALAKRFAMSDNFYCDSDHSGDGHRWLVGTYPNEFFEARHDMQPRGTGPGTHIFTGNSAAIYPEDYNEAGSIWELFDRNKISFRNYGLGFQFKTQSFREDVRHSGIRLSVNYPLPTPLLSNTSLTYPTYNMNIPDQFRMDMFEKEFKEKWLSGKETFPSVITIMLPNDHGTEERPDEGYPYWGSYMADNDLALGRLVELISHSPFWKDTLITVTEDDAQGYTDTVDAHRSICMFISPYSKRGYISHQHGSIASILKTMFLIQGLPPLNQYDSFASDLGDLLTVNAGNLDPYNAIPVDKRVFDPQKAFDPLDEEFNWEALDDVVPLDNQDFLDADKYGNSGSEDHKSREK